MQIQIIKKKKKERKSEKGDKQTDNKITDYKY